MNIFVHRSLGHFLMNEAPTDGGPAGGATPPASDPAAPPSAPPAGDPPAATPPATPPADAPPAAKEVPEKYEFANLPEGYKLDDAALGEWSGVFKELNLTQEQAQKLVEMDAKRFTAANSPEAQQKAAIESRNQQVAQWETELKQDKDLGGANFEANVGVAQKAMAEFGTPELRTMLEQSGLGTHPEVVRFFHKVGKELGEGSLHRTTTEQPKEISIVDAFR
ncbi:hypothetical protein [Pseudomonas sp. RIT-To-2]|uniref:hypothetical protein n=1 Tax=Pseudomonas sp. RIT-To-2 TaxID=3462541 RepID=UPI002412EF50